jgi:triacylglycerol lipase
MMAQLRKRDPRAVLPVISWDSIAPPYLEYSYFQGKEDCPFRPQADGFDLVNAWWLIEASTLAYAEEDFARRTFQEAGFPEVAFFSGDSTQGYVVSNDAFLILVFRGTEIRRRAGQFGIHNIMADVGADADILLVDSGFGGKVHRGFQEALDEVWEKKGLLRYLRQKETPGRPFWFTGHSLGAALATLAASRYGRSHDLYTFGSPRVGDLDFKNGFPVKAYRFVNHRDIVTRVPPPGLYQHVGEEKYLDSQGLLREGEKGPDPGSLEIPHAGWLNALIPGAVVDHVPTLYATHVWNNLP